MVFHPLRSELNWPLGDKHPLDFAPLRWQLPMVALEAMLAMQAADGSLSTEPAAGHPPNSREADCLHRLSAAVRRGLEQQTMQAVPHLVLLSDEFYHAELRAPLRDWHAPHRPNGRLPS